MSITKRIWSPQPIEDMENLKATIDNILAEALAELKDPEAYAVRKMFNKIKEKPKTATEPNLVYSQTHKRFWNADNECWLPKGTSIKPHPWDSDE